MRKINYRFAHETCKMLLLLTKATETQMFRLQLGILVVLIFCRVRGVWSGGGGAVGSFSTRVWPLWGHVLVFHLGFLEKKVIFEIILNHKWYSAHAAACHAAADTSRTRRVKVQPASEHRCWWRGSPGAQPLATDNTWEVRELLGCDLLNEVLLRGVYSDCLLYRIWFIGKFLKKRAAKQSSNNESPLDKAGKTHFQKLHLNFKLFIR